MRDMEKLFLGLCIIGVILCPGINCDNHGKGENNWDHCAKEKDRGPCSNWTIRWYYVGKDNKCDRFWFGGCDGNENNFLNKTECQSYCMSDKKGTG